MKSVKSKIHWTIKMTAIFSKQDDQDGALVNIEYFLDSILLSCIFHTILIALFRVRGQKGWSENGCTSSVSRSFPLC